MTTQLTFQSITPLSKEDSCRTIQERFEIFDRLNPHIYTMIVEMACKLKRKGHKRIGIGMLWEVLRWQYMERVVDPNSGYKLNDHYRSRYARKIASNEPDLANIFETRKIHTP